MSEHPARTAAGLPLPEVEALHRDPLFLARFWSKVKHRRGCLVWSACGDEKGYGRIRVGRVVVGAHRVAFALHHGHWPDPALMVLHSCDNPGCCNPLHLREGTALENQLDIVARGRHASQKRRLRDPKEIGVERWRGGQPHTSMLRGKSRLTEDDVRTIRARYEEPDDALVLAVELDVAVDVVMNVVKGRTFRWVVGE